MPGRDRSPPGWTPIANAIGAGDRATWAHQEVTAGGQCCPNGTPVNAMSSAELYTPAVLVPAPALFSASGNGKEQGAIWQAQTGQIATADNPP